MNEIELKLRENRRKRMTESKLREGYYLISYNYDGDELSDYRSTMLVKANSEEEALKKAREKKSDGRHFEIDRSHKEFPDGYVDSLETWRSEYPKSNYDIQEKKEDEMIRADHTPVSTANKPQINESAADKEEILFQLKKLQTEVKDAIYKFEELGDLPECRSILTYLVRDSQSTIKLISEELSNSMEESQINEATADSLLTIENLKKATYSYSFMNDRAWVTVDGHRYVKIGPDKWEYQPLQAKAIGGTYSSEQLFDEIKNATKVEYDLYLKPVNEASWDDDDDEDYDEFGDEENYDSDDDVVVSNWKRLKDLQGDFWTNLDELIEDIEDKLGYEVVFKSREYLSIIDPDAEDDAEYKLTLGGTERTIVVELDSSYPM